jgi:hypothetical protein
MANNDGWVAGRYSLNAVTLRKLNGTSVSIINEIVGFNIFESMKSPAMHGTVTVFDKKNIMRDFDIKGEEVIEFDYADWWGHQRIMTFFVYGISDVRYPDDDRSNGAFIQYTLNFVSAEKVFTEDTAVMKSYKNGKISDYVQEVYDEFYKGAVQGKFSPKRLHTPQPTTGEMNLVIPNLTPEQTMEFLARRAYASDSRTSTFRFFENRNGFWFGDIDYVFNQSNADGSIQIPKYFYNIKGDISAEGQESVMRTIMSAHFGDKVNTVDDIDSGAYRRQIIEIDWTTGAVTPKPVYDFVSEFQSPTEKLVHESDFVNERMNNTKPRRIFIVKDYSAPGHPEGPAIPRDRFISEILQVKPSYNHHYRYNTVQITIHGDNSLFAGGKINLEFDERHEPDGKVPQVDKERSGIYYIESIDNIFFNNMYMQKCTVSRFGVGK